MTESDIPEIKEKPQILIVDDNPQNLQVLGRHLQEQNYHIEFATNGKAALEWIGMQNFDLILLDINMPLMGGFEVCSVIRSNPALNKVPVIFLSADVNRDSVVKGFELGAQDYVTKPFDKRELIERVKTHLTLKNSIEKLQNFNTILEEKVKERTHDLLIANEALEKMNDQLVQLDNAKAEFLNLISHEIRTPLNGIMLPLELLKDNVDIKDSKDLLDMLDISVKRLEKFSFNALLITRLKLRPSQVSKQIIEIDKLIDEIILENKPDLIKKKINFKIHRDEQCRTITGEKHLIKKCFLCILENSITYSPPEDMIEINIFNKDNMSIVEISDNGDGFSPEILKNGIEPFSRGNRYHDKSLGLGIPLAKLIMNAHGGDIYLSNKKEKGALVTMAFR